MQICLLFSKWWCLCRTKNSLTVNVFVIYCSQMICVTALRTHLPRFERKDPEQNRVTRGKSFPFSIVPLVRPCACSCVERAMPVVWQPVDPPVGINPSCDSCERWDLSRGSRVTWLCPVTGRCSSHGSGSLTDSSVHTSAHPSSLSSPLVLSPSYKEQLTEKVLPSCRPLTFVLPVFKSERRASDIPLHSTK